MMVIAEFLRSQGHEVLFNSSDLFREKAEVSDLRFLPGKLTYGEHNLVLLLIWLVNIAASLLWLRFFQFGPLEWLWRSLTYWQLQPLRLTTAHR